MRDKKSGRKYRNLLGVLLLIGSVVATQLPLAEVEATSSSITDFQMDGTTLLHYTGTATTVTVPSMITTIASGAFSGDTDLYTVHLPDKLERIESDAFAGCSMLTVVDFPDTLKEIGSFAFSGCDSLTDVDLGKHVTQIGEGAFSGCDSLADIRFHKDNASFTSYGGALYDKDKTTLYQVYAGSQYTKYTMPDSVREMKRYAFWGCDKLRFIYVNSFIKDIPDYGFSNCTGLEEITLPYSLKTIGIKSFANCINLASATIPPTVHTIHATAFDGCPKLVITAQANSEAKRFDDARDKTAAAAAEYEDTAGQADISSQYPVSGGAAAGGNEAGTAQGTAAQTPGQTATATQPSQAQGSRIYGQTAVVGGNAFVFIDNASANVLGNAEQGQRTAANSNVQFPDNGSAADASPESDSDKAAQETEQADSAAGNGAVQTAENAKQAGFPKYTIVEDLIAGQAYYKDTELTDYEIPQNIKRIGDFAFARSALKQITIPEGVEQIGYGAFYHCDDLEQVSIASSVTKIEPSAFTETKWLQNWQNGGSVNDYLIVGDGILLAYKGKDSRITIPEGIKQIGPAVFQDHKGITTVSLPNSLEIIGEEAFSGCSNLKTVTGGVAVTEIQDRAFAGCPIETIRIPQSVTQIGLQAYDVSASALNQSNAVVFMGSTLPKVGYEKAATRLSNEEYRDLSFKGVQVAIISDAINDYTGTVLDEELYGFRGLICSVQREASGGNAGILKIKASTLEEDAKAPESVTVYGSVYGFSNAAKDAGLTTVEERTTALSAPPADTVSNVKVLVNSNVLPASKVSAILADVTGSYYVSVRDSSDAQYTILKAYQTLYGTENEPLLYGFDIHMLDSSMSIPITKLGSNTMKLKLPLPEGIGETNLHVVCTDEDGQLEDLAYQLYTQDGQRFVEFQVRHFSPYGIYQYGNGSQAVVENDHAVFTSLTRQKDSAYDTGDWLHPKWFLAVGLFASAMVAFLGGRRKVIEHIGT